MFWYHGRPLMAGCCRFFLVGDLAADLSAAAAPKRPFNPEESRRFLNKISTVVSLKAASALGVYGQVYISAASREPRRPTK